MRVFWLLLGLSVLVLWHEMGHALVARALRLHLTDFSFGFGPTMASRSWRGVRWRWGMIPFGGFVRVAQLSLRADEPGRFLPRAVLSRLLTIVAGSAANLLLAAILAFSSAWWWGEPTGAISGLQVTMVPERSALRVGDRIEKINDIEVKSVHDLRRAVAKAKIAEVQLWRAGNLMHLPIVPIERAGKRGFDARYVIVEQTYKPNLRQALGIGARAPYHQAISLFRNSGTIVRPDSGVRPVTAVGLADRVSQTGRWDGRRLFSLASTLSVAVGLFNLLPIPGLDGARFVLEVVESVRRKRISIRWALYVQVAGAVFLGLLWLWLGWLVCLGR